MATRRPTDEALEAHLQALTAALDLQLGLVRSAFGLHPAASLAGFDRAADEAICRCSDAIGGLRSDLAAAAATAAGSGEHQPPTAATVEAPRPPARPSSAGGAAAAAGPGPPRASTSSGASSVSQATPPAAAPNRVRRSSTIDTRYMARITSMIGNEASPCVDGVLNPDWPPRLAWDLVVALLLLCETVVIPFQLAEFSPEPGFDNFWLWFTVGIFKCDLLINFFTAYRAGKHDACRQEGTLVTDRASIANNYLRGWFWVDFLGTLPWDVIAETFKPSSQRDTSSDGQGTQLTKALKLMRLLRLIRMLRLAKLSIIWERLESSIGSITVFNAVTMFRAIGTWTAICHWGACAWWMVGKRGSLAMLLRLRDDDPNELHWTELPRVHSASDDFGQWAWVERPASEQYVFCFYWILGVMRTMPAEVTPVNLTERIFVLLFMFFAVGAFAVNVARITQAWFKFSARRDAFKEEMVHVRMHLRTNDCGTAQQLRTQAYLSHLFEKRQLHAKELGLLNVLPEELKRKLKEASFLRFLRMIPQLEDWTDPRLRHVCGAIEILDFLPGDKVTEKYNEAEAAYVLMRGGLQVYAPNSASSIRRRSPLTVVDEHCLFICDTKASSKNTVVALESSELLRIDRQRFQELSRDPGGDVSGGLGGFRRSSTHRLAQEKSYLRQASSASNFPDTSRQHSMRLSVDVDREPVVEDLREGAQGPDVGSLRWVSL